MKVYSVTSHNIQMALQTCKTQDLVSIKTTQPFNSHSSYSIKSAKNGFLSEKYHVFWIKTVESLLY